MFGIPGGHAASKPILAVRLKCLRVHTELGVPMLSQTLVTSMEFALPRIGNCGSTDILGGLNYWGYGAGLPLTQKAGFLTQIWGFRFALTQKAGFLTQILWFCVQKSKILTQIPWIPDTKICSQIWPNLRLTQNIGCRL